MSRLAVRVTVAFPDRTRTYVYGERLVALDPLSRRFDLRAPQLQSVEYGFTVADPDNDLGGLASGALAWSLAGVAVARQALIDGSWTTTFAGVLDREPELVSEGLWRLAVRPDDLALRRDFPRAVLSVSEFPRVDVSVTAQYGPLIYGLHDSLAVTNVGMVPLPLIDSDSHDYMATWGRARSVLRVYADGVLASSGWSVVNPITPSGRRYTAVRFTADQGSKAITADIEGLEDVGDGTGALISNGARQLAHLLSNFVFADWRDGAWLAQDRIDADSFDRVAEYLDRYSAPGSSRRFLGAQQLAGAVLEEWADSHDGRLFWTSEGKLGVAIVEPQARDLAALAGHLRYDESDGGRFDIGYRPDFEDKADRLDLQFCYSAAAQKYTRSVAITEPTLGLGVGQSFDLPWSPASL